MHRLKIILLLLLCSFFSCAKSNSDVSETQYAYKNAKAVPGKMASLAGSTLSWRLGQTDLYESQISLYQADDNIATYTVSCDLSEAVGSELSDERTEAENSESPSIDIVQTNTWSQGVLIVRCIVGAHSQMVAVYDPFSSEQDAVYSKTGSYYAEWELRDDDLWVRYDQRCLEGDETPCENAFIELEEQVQ